MTKVSIIEVELDESVHTIITQEIVTLSAQNQQQLETSRAAAQLTQQLGQERRQAKQQATDTMTELLTTIHQRLLEGGEQGVPASVIQELIQGTISTMPAFTTRMKTYLRERGNQYALHKHQFNRQAHYRLLSFNQSPADSPSE